MRVERPIRFAKVPFRMEGVSIENNMYANAKSQCNNQPSHHVCHECLDGPNDAALPRCKMLF